MSRRDFPDCRDYDVDPFTGLGVYRGNRSQQQTNNSPTRDNRPFTVLNVPEPRFYEWDYPDHP